jgi:hypothetical protein
MPPEVGGTKANQAQLMKTDEKEGETTKVEENVRTLSATSKKFGETARTSPLFS